MKDVMERHPLPWAAIPCGQKECWCGLIVDANHEGGDRFVDMETCIVTAGNIAMDSARLIVDAVNRVHGKEA